MHSFEVDKLIVVIGHCVIILGLLTGCATNMWFYVCRSFLTCSGRDQLISSMKYRTTVYDSIECIGCKYVLYDCGMLHDIKCDMIH